MSRMMQGAGDRSPQSSRIFVFFLRSSPELVMDVVTHIDGQMAYALLVTGADDQKIDRK